MSEKLDKNNVKLTDKAESSKDHSSNNLKFTSPQEEVRQLKQLLELEKEKRKKADEENLRLKKELHDLQKSKESRQFANEYDVIDIIGSGQFGIVFKAVNRYDKNVYAVKRIAVDPNKYRDRLWEAHVFSRLHHRGIVGYNSTWIEKPEKGSQYGADEEIFKKFPSKTHHRKFYKDQSVFIYIQMQYCDSSLNKWLRDNTTVDSRSLPQMKRWFKQIATAVDHIHREGYIHCDLKPCNILIYGESCLRLCDMGIALERKIEDGVEQAVENSGGTPDYMSPEQTGMFVDSKTDVFTLGLIFTELCVVLDTLRKQEIFDNFRQGVKNEIFGRDRKTEEFVSYLTAVERHKRPTCQALIYLAETVLL